MSEASNEMAVFTREDGSQYTTEPFKLNKTKEVADRFRGEHTINIPLPVAVKGDLDATLRNLRAFVDPEADFAEVLVAKFVGQGLRLDTQKEVKDFLAPRGTDDTETVDVAGEAVLVKDAPVEAVLAAAQKVADEARLGSPRKKGTGKQAGKVAQAEAKAAKAVSTAVQMYRDLPPVLRAQYRQSLLDTGAVTAEELDAVDAETGGDEEGGHTAGGNRKGGR